jgi:metal-dependent amidase/aminoacylase/carboxypeptidase family protein
MILLEAEPDGLTINEQTGLLYTSKEAMVDQYGFECPIMHAYGLETHLTCLLGAADSLNGAHCKRT